MKKEEALKRLDAIKKEQKELRAIIEASEKKTSRVPNSIKDVWGRKWWISCFGDILEDGSYDYPSLLSTKERAEAVLSLIQLLEIHGAIEQEKEKLIYNEVLYSIDGTRKVGFWFESEKLSDEFKRKHKDLIETVEKGL